MYSKGISWIDDCRIPFEDTQNPATNPKYRLQGNYKMPEKGEISDGSITQFRSSLNEIDTRGRFPANILVSDDMLNDGIISKAIKSKRGGAIDSNSGTYNWNEGNTKNIDKYLCGFNDKGTNSRYYDIDKWFEKLLDD